ncbi:MAG TPA: flagellar motor protein MotB [Blastocatellia bacterium]|nr:flagellar motor protein MotB [Blastocatellia bacterium]
MSAATKGKKDEPEKKPRRRIKKVVEHGGHHGGSWKVAYADFVTAMMALFLVLWLLSQADTKLKAAVANYFRSPGVFNMTNGGVLNGPKSVTRDPSPDAASEEQMFDVVAKQLRERISGIPDLAAFKDRVKIDVTDEGLRIQIIDKADRVTFASGSAQLSPEAKLLLTEIAKALCQTPNPIAIGGHTDQLLFPKGSIYTNWELSADRANAARRALEAECIKPEQVRRVIGYADTELLYPNQPFAAANRRINITLLRLHKPAAAKDDEKTKVVEEKASAKETDASEEKPAQKKRGREKGAEKTSEDAQEETNEETSGAEHSKNKASASSGKHTHK